MVKMDLAYEIEPQGTDHRQRLIFVPTILEFHEDVAKGERRLEWTFEFQQDVKIIYIGRRLQCKDQELTTLTPGFFPQVQVNIILFVYIYIYIYIYNMSFHDDLTM
jgi:hypothetical protein